MIPSRQDYPLREREREIERERERERERVHPRFGDQGRHARVEHALLPGRISIAKPWQVDRITRYRCVPTPFAIGGIEEDDKHGPVSVWLTTSSILSLSLFVSFVESVCDIELHVGQGTRTFFFFFVYYTWTREPAPVRVRRRALLSTCQPSLLPVVQGRFLPLVLQV